MRVKEKIDYIYFCCKKGRKNRVQLEREAIAQIQVLKIEVTVKGNQTESIRGNGKAGQRLVNKIKKGINRYRVDNCVIGAQQTVARELQLERQLFGARKRELLENRKKITAFLHSRVAVPQNRRKSFLFVLDSTEWTKKDFISILLEVKNYYEDISIVVKKNSIYLERIVELLYEEWGVVLRVLSQEEALAEDVDSALFLMDSWQEHIKRYSFCSGYIVLEDDSGLLRRPAGNGKQAKLYSGLVYMCHGKQLPYQMAVNIFDQNPELYRDFAITSVDIYSIE